MDQETKIILIAQGKHFDLESSGGSSVTAWLQITYGDSSVGLQQNILKETSGPTPYTKRNVFAGSSASEWRLLILGLYSQTHCKMYNY